MIRLLQLRGLRITENRSWSFTDHAQLVEAAQWSSSNEFIINRLAPGDGHVDFSWRYEGTTPITELNFYAFICLRGTNENQRVVSIDSRSDIRIVGLENGRDYELQMKAVSTNGIGETVMQSPVRLVRPGIIPGKVINYIHPEDCTYDFSGRSPASPSIAELPDGRLVI